MKAEGQRERIADSFNWGEHTFWESTLKTFSRVFCFKAPSSNKTNSNSVLKPSNNVVVILPILVTQLLKGQLNQVNSKWPITCFQIEHFYAELGSYYFVLPIKCREKEREAGTESKINGIESEQLI